MAITTTQTHPKLLWPGLLKVWSESMHGDWDEEYSKIFDTVSSDKAFEEMQQVTYYGLAPEKAQGAVAHLRCRTARIQQAFYARRVCTWFPDH